MPFEGAVAWMRAAEAAAQEVLLRFAAETWADWPCRVLSLGDLRRRSAAATSAAKSRRMCEIGD